MKKIIALFIVFVCVISFGTHSTLVHANNKIDVLVIRITNINNQLTIEENKLISQNIDLSSVDGLKTAADTKKSEAFASIDAHQIASDNYAADPSEANKEVLLDSAGVMESDLISYMDALKAYRDALHQIALEAAN